MLAVVAFGVWLAYAESRRKDRRLRWQLTKLQDVDAEFEAKCTIVNTLANAIDESDKNE